MVHGEDENGGFRAGLTQTEYYDIASDDDRLAVVASTVSADRLLRGSSGPTYKPSGKNCEMPPSTMMAPTARFTMRLEVPDQCLRSVWGTRQAQHIQCVGVVHAGCLLCAALF